MCKLMVKRCKNPLTWVNRQHAKRFSNYGLGVCWEPNFSKISASWSWSGFSNRQKIFLFKFYNTILGINTRTSHFGTHGTGNWYFCFRKNPPRNNYETFLHLFLSWSTSSNWSGQCLQTCLPEVGFLTLTDKTKLRLLRLLEKSLVDVIFAAVISFQFCIWDHKLRKNVPFFHTLFAEFISLFWETCRLKSVILESGSVLNFELCRIIFRPPPRSPWWRGVTR